MSAHDIELPPLPEPAWVDGEPYWYDRHMEAYARAAIKADRKRRGEPVELDRYDAGYLGGQDGMAAHVWHDIIRAELDRAYDFYMDQLDRVAPQPAEPVKVPSDTDILDLWAGDPTHSRPVMGKNKVLAFARALLARYGQPVEPEGWQLVPKEPTEEMLIDAIEASLLGRPSPDDDSYVRSIVEAWCAATPKFGEKE